MFKKHVQLVKPKIIFGNLVSVAGGFLLAAKGNVNYILLMFTLIGVSLVIASSCILNNIIDRDIDKKMERTKNRILASGFMSLRSSIFYAVISGIIGLFLLYFYVNHISTILAVLGSGIYVVIYSFYMKRRSIYSTLIGSIAGATPPVIGYCAVTSKFNICALILALIFSLWQIPHSYSIAILFLKDYKSANIPVLPVIKGIQTTKNHIIFYILLFIISIIMLTIGGYAGYMYLIVSLIVSLIWFIIALSGYKTDNNTSWARQLFMYSIFTITIVSIMISID
ncbi:protoheme IX farnesyltransferase [Candidatus Pantoea edessiphila]|uniref:Protoheme IX farnesyltransferase n=1 Tax=Candidatus Pantoea edessiphila TaxID=2044610 RepID=A0A2P5SXJ1_9GAMM|nr:heme o synthase [Candidatus Pantoea edessiphila]MBK4775793.1 protoheme IX farnesyltransferase [Pantoea sp. Edef]PPI87023.1 protoheme IX farnesyltransferase [Candidatus Pantoea edessiphila]